MTVHVTVELSDEQKTRLDDLARSQGAAVETLVVDAVTRMLDYDAWHRAMVQEALDDVDAGRTVSHDEVVAQGRARRETLLARKSAG